MVIEIEYALVSGTSAESLVQQVHVLLSEGWSTQGGASVASMGDDDYLFVQAMMRENHSPEVSNGDRN